LRKGHIILSNAEGADDWLQRENQITSEDKNFTRSAFGLARHRAAIIVTNSLPQLTQIHLRSIEPSFLLRFSRLP